MIVIIILAVVVAICIGFFIWKKNKNKSAKNCSCGYAYKLEDAISYRNEEKITNLVGTQSSSVYVTMECPQCKRSQEKRIIVKYTPNMRQTVEDGIRNFFKGV